MYVRTELLIDCTKLGNAFLCVRYYQKKVCIEKKTKTEGVLFS